MHDLVNW